MKPVRSTGLMQQPDAHKYMNEQNAKVLDGNISFGSTTSVGNMKGRMVRAVSTGVPQLIYHGLGYIPSGFLIVDKSAACDFFNISPWDANYIRIQATAPGVDFTIFVIG